jgi:hypothetical protein
VVSSHTKLIFNGTKTINKFSSSYLEEKYQDKEQGGKKRGGFRVETRTKSTSSLPGEAAFWTVETNGFKLEPLARAELQGEERLGMRWAM